MASTPLQSLPLTSKGETSHSAPCSELSHRAAILDAAVHAAEQLLVHGHWQAQLPELLQTLALATHVDRITLLQHGDRHEPVELTCIAAWGYEADEGGALPHNPFRSQYYAPLPGRWVSALNDGRALFGLIDAFEGEEVQYLMDRGAGALLMLPIHVGAKWWGVLSLEHDHPQREWYVGEVDAINTTTNILGAAILRDGTEAALLSLIQEREHIFESLAIGMFYLQGRTILRINPRVVEIFGWSESELIGQSVCMLFPDIQACERHVQQAAEQIAAGQTVRGYYELRSRHGRVVWVSLVGRWVDARTPAKGTIWMVEDITQERHNASEILAAKEEAERANRAKSAFLAAMSHEIRTPMNGVLGMTALLNETALNPEQQHYVDTILYSGKTLLQVINDILDISKLQAGKVSLELEPFSLLHVLSAIEDIFDYQARQRGIELTVELDPNVPQYLLGDAARLNQMLFNLVGNAIKFTHDGYVAIRVLPLAEESGESQIALRIEIEDTGIGIADEFHANLFAAFTQAESTTSRLYGGTGLGLMITRSLVQMMGGEIAFSSQLGEGSLFWITPRFEVAAEADIRQLQQPSGAGAEVGGGRLQYDAEILVVEDNSVNQMLAEKVLALYGCRVTTVDNGEEALKLLLEDWHRFALVLMDCEMPVMDGYQATQEIRLIEADQQRQHIPIIALSAHAMEETIQKTVAVGMDGYISKPFSFEDIAHVLQQWLPAGERLMQKGHHPQPTTAIVPVHRPQPEIRLPLDRELLEGVIDLQAIVRLRQADPDGLDHVLHRIIDTFLHHQPVYLDQLRRAIQRQDHVQIAQLAHTLKSASANVGATELSQRCAHLERHHPDMDDVKQQFTEIRRVSIRVAQVLCQNFLKD